MGRGLMPGPAVHASADPAAFEALMRRYNPRLFRVARAILKDEGSAEDALQDAYVQAYRQLGTFRGEADMGTWLTRIVINQALMQLRKRKRERVVVPFPGPESPGPGTRETQNLEETAAPCPGGHQPGAAPGAERAVSR